MQCFQQKKQTKTKKKKKIVKHRASENESKNIIYAWKSAAKIDNTMQKQETMLFFLHKKNKHVIGNAHT